MSVRLEVVLVIDAGVNLLLGGLLLLFPLGIGAWLGVPPAGSAFYPTILGGVLFGIGNASLLEALGVERGLRGLGITGAIAIYLCGAGVLAVWLVTVPSTLPLRGQLFLWTIVVGVLAIGWVELRAGAGRA
jgi:hypothetical protein